MLLVVKKILAPTFRTATVSLLIGLLGTASPPPSHATEEDPSSKKTKLEATTVTAQKREEDVQKVPESITVLSDTEVEDAQIESTRDVWKYVPNMFSSNAGSRDYFSRVAIRGISNTAFGDPGVALYIDDVSYADVNSFDNSLYDIERIEVLKGPQGTLYGKNTEGGVINIVTKSPANYFGGKASAEVGNYNKWRIDGLINAPIIEDKLFVRIAALKSSRDGYIKNIYNDSNIDNHDTTSGYGSLLYKPIDKLSFNLTFRAHEFDDSGGFPMVPMDKGKFGAATGVTNLGDFENSYNYVDGVSSSKGNTTSLRIKYEWDYFDLVSVTAYRTMDNEDTIDGDLSPNALLVGSNGAKSKSFTQELRLQSKSSDESFKWLLGLYYGDDDEDYKLEGKADSILADMMGIPLYTVIYDVSADIDAEDMAAFGVSTVRFFDNALGLTAGLRYERSKRSMDKEQTDYGSAPVVMDGLEETFSELLPKVAIDYFLTDNIMIYASFAKGYKSGGFSYATNNPELVKFDPEVSTAYELGLKTEFPDLGLRFNFAGFYTKVDDYQDRVQLDPFTVIQENVTEANIYGFELEALYAITDTLTLSAFLGYTDAKYGEYIDPLTQANFEDNRIVLIPEYNSGAFLTYRDKLGIFARAEMQFIGSMYFDRANTKKQNPYSLYNAKVGYEREKWDIYFSVKNITDEQYFVEAYEDPDLGFLGLVGEPRTFSLIFKYRF